jgi:hypothetical protein
MNCSDQRHRPNPSADEQLLAELLAHVRGHFYSSKPPAVFQRDRRRLLHALSWPAHWLDHRGLFCSPARYRTLLLARIDAIRSHGDPACYGPYFPTYLLKCLQDFFDRHDDELHAEFRHLRNALDAVYGSLRFAEKATVQSRQIAALASVHRLLRSRIPPPDNPAQMPLF